MPPILSALRGSPLPCLLGLLAALCIAAPAATAQDCLPPGFEQYQTMPVCPVAPRVSVSPGTVDVSQPTVQVTATAEDENIDGDPNTFRVYLDGTDVTATWDYTTEAFGSGTGKGTRFISRATLTVSEATPIHTVMVRLCDATACSTQSATYTLHLAGVKVGPDGTAAAKPFGGPRTVAFTVTNHGTVAAIFPLTPACRQPETGATVSCTVSPTSLSLPPGQSQQATVSYASTNVGVTLAVTLSARHPTEPGVQDAGWVDVTVYGTGGAQAAPMVQMVDLNSGAQIDRGQCVTASVGAGAAYECGDLRLVHALPAIGTGGKTRAPVLIYNSQHAHARPMVYADVTLPAGANAPDSVIATLVLGDGRTVRRSFGGQDWRPGTTRRVSVQWDALGDGIQLFPYTLQVANLYAGAQYPSGTLHGEVAVVNRYAATIGAGWWVAGVEQLACVNCASGGSRLLWVGGDGSTRVYEPTVPGAWGTWTAQQPDGPPDTLTLAASQYTRKLRGGGEIHYDGGGRHVRTVNRLGQVTTFAYDAQSRLQAVYPPTWSREARWTFTRDATTGALLNVCAYVAGVGCRSTIVDCDASGRVAGFQDPDGHWVRFGYGTAVPFQVLSRTDRRGTISTFAYDAAGKLASVKLPLKPNDTITTRYTAAEGKGLTTSVGSSETFTLLDGPRTDVADETRIWVTRWGAPVRIVDAMGAETRIRRTDPFFPALVTEVTAPSGLRTEARYDARGRVDTMIVHNPLGLTPAQNAVTTYAYDDRWDRPDTVTAPLVGRMTTAYDPANGNILWQQQGNDAARRVHFRYYGAGAGAAAGQLRAVQSPADAQGQVATDSLWYDEQGNLKGARSPLGFLTLHYRDELGRDTLTITPVDSATAKDTVSLKASGARQRTAYDLMDRPWRAETIGPARTYSTNYNSTFTPAPTPEQRLIVETRYTPEGAPESVVRWSPADDLNRLTTDFVYDAAGRKTSESSTQDGLRTFTYDHAGNVTVARTPRGYEMRMQYDALGRLTRRTVPAVAYGKACDNTLILQNSCEPFPRFPNSGDGYAIAEEWTYFAYDAAGNQVRAENADGIVLRSYYPNGALKTDSTFMRTYGGIGFTQHSYGLEYGYDLAGRVRWMRHPTNLASSGAQVDSFAYHAVTGALERMRDRQGHVFTWSYDNAGLLRTSTMPGSITETMSYDSAGRMLTRTETGPYSGLLHRDTLRYDARGKIILADNGESVYQQWYSSLGALEANDWQNLYSNVSRITDQYRADPLGNVTWRKTSREATELLPGEYPEFENVYQPMAGRLLMSRKILPASPPGGWVPDSTTRAYDNSGNVVHGYHRVGKYTSHGTLTVGQEEETRSYYSAEDRLVAMQKYDVRNTGEDEVTGTIYYKRAGVWEEYRYDALGRRIMVRTRGDGGMCDLDAWTCTSSITRFVWAGDQLLWELRAPGQEGANLEATSGSGAAFGRVSYTHAGGIDRPLVITKDGVASIVPHQNWRGQFARGTYASGALAGQVSDCASYPPQNCVAIQWPGERTTVYHELTKDGRIQNWYGGLVDGMRDATGQMYMRNRYYDPATGQFTQTDPIGLAGGLNAYGFAAGDPVSYSDPYGLCAEHESEQDTTRALRPEEEARLRCIAQNRLAEGARDAFLNDLDQGLVRVGTSVSGWAWVPLQGQQTIVLLEGTIMRHTEANVALTISHEVGHKGQRSRRDVQNVLRIGEGAYELIRHSMEIDAESYAYHVVTDRSTADYCER